MGARHRPRDDARLRRRGPQVRRRREHDATGGRPRTRRTTRRGPSASRASSTRTSSRASTSTASSSSANRSPTSAASPSRTAPTGDARRQARARADRRLLGGPALLPRRGLASGRQRAAGVRQAPDEHQPPPAAAVPRDRGAVEPRLLRRRVFLQGGRPDGAHASLPDLVNVADAAARAWPAEGGSGARLPRARTGPVRALLGPARAGHSTSPQ